MTLVYWHWFVFGMILMLCELIIPSFTIFWFGLAAINIGLILALGFEIPLLFQLGSWSISAVIFSGIWIKLSQRITPGSNFQAEMLSQTALVIAAEVPGKVSGKLRFSVSIAGTDEWLFTTADKHVKVGDVVRVIETHETLLVVEAVTSCQVMT